MFKGSFHCRKNFAHGGMAVWGGGGVNVCPEGPWILTEGGDVRNGMMCCCCY